MLYTETVEASTLDLINRLMSDSNLSEFKLVGGTALALMIGHRISVDIDLFTNESFDANRLADILSSTYRISNLEVNKNTITCFIEDIKVDCMSHRYPWIKPDVITNGIRMTSLEDIAAMKINAIVQNGSRLKDFIDIYALLEHRNLNQLLLCYEQKYPNINVLTAANALLYHNDIKSKLKLDLINPNISWSSIVKRLKQATKSPLKIFEPESKMLIQKIKRQSRGRRI